MPRFEPGKNELAFYKAERERWPVLQATDITDAWALKALKKLTRHFHLDRLPYGNGPIPLVFKGRNVSWGGYNGITLAKARDWLIFLHEVAHVWEYRKHGETEHRKRLVGYVDRLCRYAVKMGWPQADLDEQFTAWCAQEADEQMTEAFAVEPPGHAYDTETVRDRAAARAERIEHREAQLARLERKIKSLTTRAAKVRRSLNALRRANAPHSTGRSDL